RQRGHADQKQQRDVPKLSPHVDDERQGRQHWESNTQNGPHGVTPKPVDRKSTRLNSSHSQISYAVFCLKKKKKKKKKNKNEKEKNKQKVLKKCTIIIYYQYIL